MAELQANLAGVALFTVTNLNSGGDTSASEGCIIPGTELPFGGGINTTLAADGNVDLTTLPLTSFVNNQMPMVCLLPFELCSTEVRRICCEVTTSSSQTGSICWRARMTCRRPD